MAKEEWVLGQPENTQTVYEWVLGQPVVSVDGAAAPPVGPSHPLIGRGGLIHSPLLHGSKVA